MIIMDYTSETALCDSKRKLPNLPCVCETCIFWILRV
ncbi:hypothetical protein LEMLEM_LOCUS14608 [Lemmus lemmus]